MPSIPTPSIHSLLSDSLVEYFHAGTHLEAGERGEKWRAGDKVILSVLSWVVSPPLERDARCGQPLSLGDGMMMKCFIHKLSNSKEITPIPKTSA